MLLTPEQCYQALRAQDIRFDGRFFVGVSTTGIYCRPICTAKTPRLSSCTFYANAASAEQDGYRPCLRCRPELAPELRSDVNGTDQAAMVLQSIRSGRLQELGQCAIAREIGISPRHLRRVVIQKYGVSPGRLMQTQRLLMAKQLLTDTRLRIIDIAFASGFNSVRRFNHVFKENYGLTPGMFRKNSHHSCNSEIVLRLGFRPPLDWESLIHFLTSRSSPHVEQAEGSRYFRTVKIDENSGWLCAVPDEDYTTINVRVSATLLPVLNHLTGALRGLFDLGAMPEIIHSCLSAEPQLKRLIRKNPGLRIPGSVNGFDVALRAILGQQISVAAASTLYNRVTEQYGRPIDTPFAGLDRMPCEAGDMAGLSQRDLVKLGITGKRADTILQLARAVASGKIILRYLADKDRTIGELLKIRGIGPWTAQYVAMRVISDPDAFPHNDLGLLRAMNVSRSKDLIALAEKWRPWRAYAAMYLWNNLNNGG